MGLELDLKQYRKEGDCVGSRGNIMMCDTEVETDLAGWRVPGVGDGGEVQLHKKMGQVPEGPEHQAEGLRLFTGRVELRWVLRSDPL